MKILVTGFQPFGGEHMNPALEAVRRLPDTIAGAQVVKAELPVVFGRDGEVLRAAVAEQRPDVCLCIGQAGGRTHITPEFVGINYAHARIPDNDGNQPLAQPIVEGGPDAYFTLLPVHAMVDRMRAAGVPAAVSYTAGTYCCNEMLYTVLHLCATVYPEMRGGFIHVPYATEQAARLGDGAPSMSIDTMVKGLTLAIETCVEVERGDIVGTVGGTEQ